MIQSDYKYLKEAIEDFLLERIDRNGFDDKYSKTPTLHRVKSSSENDGFKWRSPSYYSDEYKQTYNASARPVSKKIRFWDILPSAIQLTSGTLFKNPYFEEE